MDPLSVTASAVTVIELLSQSCLFLCDFLRNFCDAPVNVKHHHIALQALYAGLRKIQDLHTKNPSTVELSPEFSALVPEWLADFVAVEAKLRKIRDRLGEGRGTRAWARVTWALSSEQWLEKFLKRVHVYHAVFSSELMLVLINISIAQSKSPPLPQSSETASQPQAGHALVDQHAPETLRLALSTNMITMRAENYGVIRTQSIKPVEENIELHHSLAVVSAQQKTDMMDPFLGQSADRSSLTCFLENFVEPASIKSNHSYIYEARCASLALSFGPLIVKQFSQQQEVYKISSRDYCGLSIAVRLPLYFLDRMTLSVFAIKQSRQRLSFSLRWNLSFPRVVPDSAPVVRLARTGDMNAMETLFKTGKASPDDVKADGTTLLHVAALTNNYQLVEYLLRKGLNANMPNDDGETSLFFAIAHSTDYNISRLLIDKGADINHSCIDSSGPLHTFFNDVVSRVVLCHGAYLETNTKNSIGRTPLHYLAWSSRSTVRDAKAYLSDISGLTAQDDEGRTPLHYAARRGNIQLVQYFLTLIPPYEKDQVDCDGQTAFHYAVESRRVGVLDVLQKSGMDIFRKDRQGRSVLHQAAFHGNVEAVKRVLAIAGKGQLEAKDIDGKTPFHLARQYGAHSVVEYLQSAYGLSDAAITITTTSSWRSSRRYRYSWRNAIAQAMGDMGPATVALFVICLACYGFA